MSQCATCGSELKLVPAGISKSTGKAYNAFLACPNKCRQPFISATLIQPTASQVAQVGMAKDQDKKWENIRDEKREDIFLSVALNNAALIVSNEMPPSGLRNHLDVINRTTDIADGLYKYLIEKKNIELNKPPF
jgi:hypothetical protein